MTTHQTNFSPVCAPEQSCLVNRPKFTPIDRERHRGRWLSEIFPAQGLSVQNNRHQSCPACGGRDRFRCDDRNGTGSYICNRCGAGDGYSLLRAVFNCSFAEAVDRADSAGCGQFNSNSYSNPRETQITGETFADLSKLMKSLEPAKDSLVEWYLRSRMLEVCELQNLFFHPRWYYKDESDSLSHAPAMVAKLHALEGTLVGLHATLLADDGGKLCDSTGKKITRLRRACNLTSSAVRLNEATEILGLGEGVETSLALRQLFKIPVWSCCNAGLLSAVQLPKSVKHIYIAVDNDAAGETASVKLALRLKGEGRKVTLVRAAKLGLPEHGDLADYLLVTQQAS